MALRLYNSRTKKKEIFKPMRDKKVSMFVCGITPYDSPHIGNYKVFINYDVLARFLKRQGFNVFYLQNVTDVDDKIITAARAQNKSWREIADSYFAEFLDVCKRLNIVSVKRYAKATDHIKEIIKQVQRLIKKGYAYEKNGSVYFEVTKFKDYGKLSGQNPEKLHKAVRMEEDKNKKHPYDFVLWKARQHSDEKFEPSWDSPWGKGRPGWHIEDTAISEHYFGPQYDIHGGAVELKFPHHEAEIAQQESASGKKPFVKYWVHAGILSRDGVKMSKSLGNVVTGAELLSKTNPDTFRFLIASVHYRSPIHYSEKLLANAHHTLGRIREFARAIKKVKTSKAKPLSILPYAKKFWAAMEDDLNTPKALAALLLLVRKANALAVGGTLPPASAKHILSFLGEVESVFGISLVDVKSEGIPNFVMELARFRERARQEKNWAHADNLREKIRSAGYDVRDLKDGFEIVHR